MMKSLAFYSALTVVVAVVLVYAWSRNSTALATQPAAQEANAASPQAASPAAREPSQNGPRAEKVAETKRPAPKPTPRVRTYNTGDSKVWPSIKLPIVYKIEVPEVPKGITRPSPPIPPDRE